MEHIVANAPASPSSPLLDQTENVPTDPQNISSFSLISDKEVWLSTAVLVFGIVVMILMFRSLRQTNNVESILLLFTVISIIFGTLWVIAAGFDQALISSALALFGTITGYLLGNRHARWRDDLRGQKENQ